MEFKTSTQPVSYPEALSFMEGHVAALHDGTGQDLVWLLEHPPLYTAGTSAKSTDLLNPQFPVFEAGRGGQYTYHGPGQRVGYVMMDLKKRQSSPDIKKYVWQLEEWIICTLATFGITGERRDGRVGIWVVTPQGEEKIAAIGVRIRHWITYHGISINVDPDLSHFGGIVPCGLQEFGVTSLSKITGRAVSIYEVDEALKAQWSAVFAD